MLCLSASIPDFTMAMNAAFDATRDPLLHGIFAPVQREVDATPMRVIGGALPDDLAGTYIRNGPNPRFTPIGSYTYPLDGDGMMHAVRIGDGRATYQNRYVRTPSMATEERVGRALWGGVMTPITPSAEEVGPELAARYKDLPDINVVHHAGRLLALAEGDRPFLLTDELDTVGPWYFDGKLPRGITAHPKVDPVTGELVVFRYAFEAPFLTWAVVGADGGVTTAEQTIEIDGTYMIHDFAITAHFIVLFVCPAKFDMSAAQVLRWEAQRGTRVAIIDRDGSRPPCWIDAEAFWVWHFANAYEETDDRGAVAIVVDYPSWNILPLGNDHSATGGVMRARLNPASGTVRFETLDDQPTEFPRIDDRLVGRPYRYFHAASKAKGLGTGMWNLLRRYDRQTGSVVTRDNGDTLIGEAVFAPSTKGGGEDDGYLITYAYEGEVTKLLVLNASDIAGEPAAVLRVPQRVPFGLHGCWVPAAAR